MIVAVLFSLKEISEFIGYFSAFNRFKSVHEQVKREWKHNSWRLFEFDIHTQVSWWFNWGSVV